MTLTNYLELSSNKFELIHIIRKFLTNLFVFKQPSLNAFLDQNNIPEKLQKPTVEVLEYYSPDYSILEIELTDIEKKLERKKKSLSGVENIGLNKFNYDMIFLFAEDSKKYVKESISEFLKTYKVYQDCFSKTNFSYHNKKHIENLIFSKTDLIVIVFSQELNSYWNSLKLSEVLIQNEIELKDKLYLFNLQNSFIPNQLQEYFPSLHSSIDSKMQFGEQVMLASDFLEPYKKGNQ